MFPDDQKTFKHSAKLEVFRGNKKLIPVCEKLSYMFEQQRVALLSQSAFTCSKLTLETLDVKQDVKHFQSYQ